MRLLFLLVLTIANITDHGATPDDATDDSVAIQAAIDTGNPVYVPKGVFIATDLTLPVGSVVFGDGSQSVLKQPDNQPDFKRVLGTDYTTTFVGAPAWIEVRNLSIDMNYQNQGAYQNWELEHHAGVFIAGPDQAERIRARVNNLTIKNSAGDGISVSRNAHAVIRGCEFVNCWRGGLVHGSGNNVVFADSCSFISTDNDAKTRLDHEPELTGFNGSGRADAFYTNLDFHGSAHINLGPLQGGQVKLSNVRQNSDNWNSEFFCVGDSTGSVHISNSVIRTDVTQQLQVRRVGNFTAVGSEFIGDNHTGQAQSASRVLEVHHDNYENHQVIFDKCVFRAGVKHAGDTGLIGIEQNAKSTIVSNDRNRIWIKGCHFADSLDYGYRHDRGHDVLILGSVFESRVGFLLWTAKTPLRIATVTLKDCVMTDKVSSFMEGLDNTSSEAMLVIRNTEVADSAVSFSNNTASWFLSVSGGRLIKSLRAPTADDDCMPGDLWIHNRGQTERYYRGKNLSYIGVSDWDLVP